MALLSDTTKLKTTDSVNTVPWSSVILLELILVRTKDMTKAEQNRHRILILVLKNKIRDYPSIKLNGLFRLEGLRMGENLLFQFHMDPGFPSRV